MGEDDGNEHQQSFCWSSASELGRFRFKMVNSDLEYFPQGLKKTYVTMDQERPRSDLSINSRNDLRKVLHLEFLYKENKVHTFKVWWGVLERILAMSQYSRALPGHQRPVARGLPHLRSGRNRQIPTVCWVSSFCLPHPTVSTHALYGAHFCTQAWAC